MKAEVETIKINGIEYVRKGSEKKELAENLDGMPYCIVRTYSAGVFAGYIKRREGKEVEIVKARRLWYWDGAASLSQLAVDGTNSPNNCKFPCEVDKITVTEAIEIIECTNKAFDSIKAVKEWKE